MNKVDLRAAGCPQHLGVAAIGTCIGIILLSLLAAALFLTWRWRQRSPSTGKTLPVNPENVLRQPWTSSIPPNNHLNINGGPIYASKYCIPTPLPNTPCEQLHCQNGYQTSIPKLTYGVHPATRPLLPPPSPSVNSQTRLPVEWFYPNHYEEEGHWYSIIEKDGDEYFTREIKRDRCYTPPPIPRESPLSQPPSTLSSNLSLNYPKRQNSFNKHRVTPTSSVITPAVNRKPPLPRVPSCKAEERRNFDPTVNQPVFKLQEGLTLGDIARNPVTYI